jgi:hypothetical protein
MKLLIEPISKNNLYLDKTDGIILPLVNYSVESNISFSLDEIRDIKNKSNCCVFVKLNKNIFNHEIDELKNILIELDKIGVDGIFFYDLSVLELKRELNLSVDLVWNQTHMVNNYKTCNYYYSKGCKYALLGKEITLDEIKDIITKSDIISMVEVISKPSVAFSKRKLITNYYKNLGLDSKSEFMALEKVTNTKYILKENNDGTTFYLDVITNGTSVIKDLYDCGCEFIIFREFGLEDIFDELIVDSKNYIFGGCSDTSYIEKYKKLGDSTNFFFKETIYRVKKNG